MTKAKASFTQAAILTMQGDLKAQAMATDALRHIERARDRLARIAAAEKAGQPVRHDDGMLGGLPDTVLVISAAFFSQTLFVLFFPV